MSGTNNNQTSDEQIQALGLTLPSDRSQAIKLITGIYLEQVDPDDWIDPEKIASDVIQMVKTEFISYNQNAETGTKWKVPPTLEPEQVAMIMLHVHKIKNINYAGLNANQEYDILGIYQEYGKNKGIYVSDKMEIKRLIHRYNNSLDTKGVKEVIARLQEGAERVTRCDNRDLIAVNNGIFNYKTKMLEPFSPDIIFTAKCRVDYNPVATNPIIHNDADNSDWDVCSWIESLFNPGSDLPNTIWQMLGAIIRPNVRWNKAAFFYATSGNNGKGSICQLMKNLTGEGTYVTIPLSDFGKEFMLEPLIRASAIITDENDVGCYLDKVANLKAVITNDTISINRKNKTPITYKFKGFMTQCINELPRMKDRSNSLYRRILFIPFDKCYTGVEKKYIKEDYLNRREVLEYVLYKVLNTNYYTLDEPAESKAELAHYKVLNNPVLSFLEEILTQADWDVLSNDLLFDAFKGWTSANNPNGMVPGKNIFLEEVRNIVGQGMHGWSYYQDPKNVPQKAYNSGSDPVLQQYIDDDDWWQYANKQTIRGLLRDNPIGDPYPGVSKGIMIVDD